MTNSGKYLNSPFNTPDRQVTVTKGSPDKKEKSRPFVVEKDTVDCIVDREKVYYPLLKGFNMKNNPEIKWHHRCILLDWTMEVCYELGLKKQTWWLASNLSDRYLYYNSEVKEKDLQLIGVTCLYISSKYEEI